MFSYKTYIAEEGSYIICEIQGTINQAGAQAFMKDTFVLGGKTGITLFLLDVRNAINTMNAFANYDLMYKDVQRIETEIKQTISSKVRAAVVKAAEDKSHDFVETVASNAGHKMKLFTNEEEAVTWLHSFTPYTKSDNTLIKL